MRNELREFADGYAFVIFAHLFKGELVKITENLEK